ncbi:MAG: hypothetical protein KME30_33345 [Iphinoe sp. HA4291-MV1]|nr:hypothetical protein [Iphinoe sp. HA4291-MV1]
MFDSRHHICNRVRLKTITHSYPLSRTLRERGIERVKGVHHTTIIYWVKQLGEKLPDVPKEDIIR